MTIQLTTFGSTNHVKVGEYIYLIATGLEPLERYYTDAPWIGGPSGVRADEHGNVFWVGTQGGYDEHGQPIAYAPHIHLYSDYGDDGHGFDTYLDEVADTFCTWNDSNDPAPDYLVAASNVEATAEDGGIRITWDPAVSYDTRDFVQIRYAIYRSLYAIPPPGNIPDYRFLLPDTTEYLDTDDDLLAGETYYYRVSAFVFFPGTDDQALVETGLVLSQMSGESDQQHHCLGPQHILLAANSDTVSAVALSGDGDDPPVATYGGAGTLGDNGTGMIGSGDFLVFFVTGLEPGHTYYLREFSPDVDPDPDVITEGWVSPVAITADSLGNVWFLFTADPSQPYDPFTAFPGDPSFPPVRGLFFSSAGPSPDLDDPMVAISTQVGNPGEQPARYILDAPVITSIDEGNGNLVVHWDGVDSTDLHLEVNYRVYYRTSAIPDNPLSGIASKIAGTSTSTTITGLTNGTTYHVRVAAYWKLILGDPPHSYGSPFGVVTDPAHPGYSTLSAEETAAPDGDDGEPPPEILSVCLDVRIPVD